jgi:lipopolysaccharide transport system permease protein
MHLRRGSLGPFLTMVILTVLFSRVAKLSSTGSAPYALLVMGGMLPWQFFSTSLSGSSESVVGNANLISKIYFPRLIVPASSVITSFVDFLITLALMALMMVWYRFLPDWRLLLLPLFAALSFACAIGVGLWLAALTVKYRDFRYVIPFIVQFGLYVSPVGFSSSVVSAKWRLLYSLNPVVGIIDGFRWSLLRGQSPLWWPSIVASVLLTSLFCARSVSGYSNLAPFDPNMLWFKQERIATYRWQNDYSDTLLVAFGTSVGRKRALPTSSKPLTWR